MAGHRKSRAPDNGLPAGGRSVAATARQTSASEEALREESEALLLFALTQCRNAEQARDAVQEACLRLLASEAGGRPVRNRRAWMQKVVQNLLCDAARMASRQAALADPASANEAALAEPATEARLPAGLTPREADCVRLRLRGHRYREIAEILDLHPGSVARLLSRARAKLRAPR